MTDEPTPIARRFWELIEPIHAITYFAPEGAEAMVRLGLKGFWMGYFAGRASPMGPVGAGMVEATFANFAPVLVRRAIPEAWNRTTPGDVVVARREAAAMGGHFSLPIGISRSPMTPSRRCGSAARRCVSTGATAMLRRRWHTM